MERKIPGAKSLRDSRLVGGQKESIYKKRCQKCNDTSHWTYDCKKNWQYAHRDSRTAELKKRVVEGPDGKIQVVNITPAKKPEEDEKSSDSDSSSSSSSSSSSGSTTSSVSVSSTTSSSSAADDKLNVIRRKKEVRRWAKKKEYKS